ncbi:MAG TPA: metallophosphoesterase [Thermoanaerobaculia bacterium]|nr:metallophosphoesterase [Thermoanaerobaculia bacterium]HUM29301.1 metallophosphoesterase [Thermoanaerobaculia bacterium]HXK67741.1 metallophosphoesterase [Thermoanaerobaculia bacterium]
MTLRLLHLSDIHFGPPHLYSRLEGLSGLIERADGVVISGDLTQRAKAVQFLAARKFLDSMAKPWIAVPGNHDIPLYPFHLRLFAPYLRWKRHFKGLTDSDLQLPNLCVTGICTAHGLTLTEGRITNRQLLQLQRTLLRSSLSDVRILILHHPILPLPGDTRDRSIRGNRTLLRCLASNPIDLVLSGHVHRSLMQDVRDYLPRFPYSLPVSHIGTSTTNRGRGKEHGLQSCQMVEVDPRNITLHHYLWSDSGFILTDTAIHSRRTRGRTS